MISVESLLVRDHVTFVQGSATLTAFLISYLWNQHLRSLGIMPEKSDGMTQRTGTLPLVGESSRDMMLKKRNEHI